MNDKTCFFIGARYTDNNIRERLIQVVEQHITEYGVDDFTVGHYGRFDGIVADVLSELKKQYSNIVLNLLLPYHPVHQQVIACEGFVPVYPEGLEKVPKRYAIVQANRNQIDRSDYLIAHPGFGNSRNFVEYAQRREKKGLIKVTLI